MAIIQAQYSVTYQLNGEVRTQTVWLSADISGTTVEDHLKAVVKRNHNAAKLLSYEKTGVL